MKSNKNLFSIPVFVFGMLAGLSVAFLFAFSRGPATPGEGGNSAISVSQANQFARNYLAGAEPYNQVIRGFMVGKAQLEAMNILMGKNPSLTGFRIYMGLDQNNSRREIVIGVDQNGADAVSSPVFNTDASGHNPCPPVCDSNSPILKN